MFKAVSGMLDWQRPLNCHKAWLKMLSTFSCVYKRPFVIYNIDAFIAVTGLFFSLVRFGLRGSTKVFVLVLLNTEG